LLIFLENYQQSYFIYSRLCLIFLEHYQQSYLQLGTFTPASPKHNVTSSIEKNHLTERRRNAKSKPGTYSKPRGIWDRDWWTHFTIVTVGWLAGWLGVPPESILPSLVRRHTVLVLTTVELHTEICLPRSEFRREK